MISSPIQSLRFSFRSTHSLFLSLLYQVFYSGIEEQATNILYGASEGHDQKGVTGAVGGILRQIPPTLVRPLVLASEATANVLGGMRNQIAPEARKNDAEKWRQAAS